MSYVQSTITPGETVIATVKISRFVYAWPVFWLLLTLGLCVATPPLGVSVLWLPIFLLIRAWLYRFSTELAVTSKRVIAKFGFIRRNTVELMHSKVESLHVNQGIVGRIFGFGSVVVTGSGGTNAPILYVSDPLLFRSAALAGIEAKGQ